MNCYQRLTCLDGYLSIKALRLTYKRILCLHFKLHFKVLTLVLDSSERTPCFLLFDVWGKKSFMKRGEGGGLVQQSEQSNIIYTPANIVSFWYKRDMHDFNGQFFIVFSFICNVLTYMQIISTNIL